MTVMQSRAATVSEYLDELPADRRAAIQGVRAVILQNLDPLYEEGMQYGMIGYYVPHRVYPAGYHCDPKQPLPFVCLAAQKNHLAVYLGCVNGHPVNEAWFRRAWAESGKKLDMGQWCLRFKKPDDLALEVIGELIRRTPALPFIQHYESVLIKATSRRRAKSTPREPSNPKDKGTPSRPVSAKRKA